MLQGVFVPVTVLVEHEDLKGCSVSEAKVGVKHVDVPHKGRCDVSSVNLFQIANVNIVSLGLTKQASLVENYLLRVGNEFCVPAEIIEGAHLSRHLHGVESEGHRAEE